MQPHVIFCHTMETKFRSKIFCEPQWTIIQLSAVLIQYQLSIPTDGVISFANNTFTQGTYCYQPTTHAQNSQKTSWYRIWWVISNMQHFNSSALLNKCSISAYYYCCYTNITTDSSLVQYYSNYDNTVPQILAELTRGLLPH